MYPPGLMLPLPPLPVSVIGLTGKEPAGGDKGSAPEIESTCRDRHVRDDQRPTSKIIRAATTKARAVHSPCLFRPTA